MRANPFEEEEDDTVMVDEVSANPNQDSSYFDLEFLGVFRVV